MVEELKAGKSIENTLSTAQSKITTVRDKIFNYNFSIGAINIAFSCLVWALIEPLLEEQFFNYLPVTNSTLGLSLSLSHSQTHTHSLTHSIFFSLSLSFCSLSLPHRYFLFLPCIHLLCYNGRFWNCSR